MTYTAWQDLTIIGRDKRDLVRVRLILKFAYNPPVVDNPGTLLSFANILPGQLYIVQGEPDGRRGERRGRGQELRRTSRQLNLSTYKQ